MKNNWESKYFEKNIKESHAYIFKNLEIKNYLKKHFKEQELLLQKHRVHFSGSIVNLFLSIYQSEKASSIFKKKNNNKKEFKNQLHKLKHQIEEYHKVKQALNKAAKKTKVELVFTTYRNCLANLQELTIFETKDCSIKLINELKVLVKEDKTIEKLYQNCLKNINLLHQNCGFKFSEHQKLTRSLDLFMNKKLNLNVVLQQTNLVNSKKNLRQISLRLRKFERTTFLSEGKKLLLPFSAQQNSSKLLAHFIATQLRLVKKRQNFFINFLKESLNMIVNQKFSKIKGIKLILKGRLNNATRSKHRTITIGKIPLMTTNTKIDYSESTAFTSNGTIGIKIWVCEQD